MRVLLLILSVTVAIEASNERAPLQGLPKEEKDILFELVKRLEHDDVHDKLGWKDTAQCDVSPNTSSIIKKKESLNNGAQFITLYKGAESNEACSDLCCKNVSCDLAVFEDKGENYCYLFRCDGKCKFGHHSSYISNNIAHRSQPPPSAAEGSERDLIDLGRGSDTDSKNDGESFKPTSAAATTVATAPSTYIRAHSVGLEGPYCERDLHCEDPEAICNYHKCRCREGYYRKSHICRQVCPPSNFECLELGTLGRGPQCVSDQQVCDGITQCADGSDEFNCPDTDGQLKSQHAASKEDKLSHQGDALTGDLQKSGSKPSDDKDKVVQPTEGKNHTADSSMDTDSRPLSADTDTSDKHPSVKAEEGSQESSSKEDTHKTDTADNSKPADDSSSEEKPDSSAKDNSGTGDSSKSGQAETALDSNSDSSDLVKSQNAFISRERVNLKTEESSMQGPIIALSLGLAFTVILLVFVACRLRTVRRRLRKGRPLHSNEADYLINGMYL